MNFNGFFLSLKTHARISRTIQVWDISSKYGRLMTEFRQPRKFIMTGKEIENHDLHSQDISIYCTFPECHKNCQ